jgi:hypothetical protein
VLPRLQAEQLVHRMDRHAAVQGDMGLALFKLCKLEEAQGPHLAQYTGTVRGLPAPAQTQGPCRLLLPRL